jgi:hypothetical protein
VEEEEEEEDRRESEKKRVRTPAEVELETIIYDQVDISLDFLFLLSSIPPPYLPPTQKIIIKKREK